MWLLIGLVFLSGSGFGVGQTGTPVIGILTTDATWNKTNSPYTLTGPVAINSGVTLIIEPGVQVELNSFYIQVNGTLIANGTTTEKIIFEKGAIIFTNNSKGWAPQIQTGCILENVVLTGSLTVSGSSPKITANTLNTTEVKDGQPSITNNLITKMSLQGGAPYVANNTFYGSSSFEITGGSPTITNNTINTRIFLKKGDATISNNTITGGVHADSSGGKATIIGNTITLQSANFYAIFQQWVPADIINNTIVGNGESRGIRISAHSPVHVSGNVISGCSIGINVDDGTSAVIERNLLFNNAVGVVLQGNATFTYNTVSFNVVGVKATDHTSLGNFEFSLANNNIQNNSQYNLYWTSQNSFDASNVWWGTTDSAAINQSIYDIKNDFNLGAVNFMPILPAPVTDTQIIPTTTASPSTAPSNTVTPTPTPTPTTSVTLTPANTQTPLQSTNTETSSSCSTKPQEITLWLYVVIALMAAVIVVLAICLALALHKHNP